MLGLKLIHVGKGAPGRYNSDVFINAIPKCLNDVKFIYG